MEWTYFRGTDLPSSLRSAPLRLLQGEEIDGFLEGPCSFLEVVPQRGGSPGLELENDPAGSLVSQANVDVAGLVGKKLKGGVDLVEHFFAGFAHVERDSGCHAGAREHEALQEPVDLIRVEPNPADLD